MFYSSIKRVLTKKLSSLIKSSDIKVSVNKFFSSDTRAKIGKYYLKKCDIQN